MYQTVPKDLDIMLSETKKDFRIQSFIQEITNYGITVD